MRDQPNWRSLLYVPATAERFVAKAHTRGADVVILDLEDSIPPAEKQAARDALPAAAATVGQAGAEVCVRINRPLEMAMRDIEAGITYINGPTIGAEVHLPFGGVKQTGNGHREVGTTALDVFTEWKTVYVDFSGSLQRAQIDNRT